jgi:hypothetical protein
MPISAEHTTHSKPARTPAPGYGRKCLACGTEEIKRGRRYCSKECRQRMHWVLSLSKGLLKTFNVKYAAFHFTPAYVVLDMLPVWSKSISRFSARRTPGVKPSEDLKELVLRAGEDWYRLVDNRASKSYASLAIVSRNHDRNIDPGSLMPNRKTQPRLSRQEKGCMKVLKLQVEDLCSEGHLKKIRSSYRQLAKHYHPDVGGNEEKFKKLNEAHEYMMQWAENPRYTSKKALQDCWSYNRTTDRWSPPL